MLHLAVGGDPSPDLSSGPTMPQVGFVVSRAVGNAVVRNRVRRRLRHLVRDLLTDLPPGAVLVVRALPAAAGARDQSISISPLSSSVAAGSTP